MSDRFRVKVCGLTSAADARLAVDAGADALGVVFWEGSPRAVTPRRAADVLGGAPTHVARVGVFVDATVQAVARAVATGALDFVQLAGDEPAGFAHVIHEMTGARVIRAIHVDGPASLDRFADYPADRFLLDAPRRAGRGGTGRRFEWNDAARMPWSADRVIVAGGLRADNVADALRALEPGAVDVCSGVESKPGRKDPHALRAFVAAVRIHDAGVAATLARPITELR